MTIDVFHWTGSSFFFGKITQAVSHTQGRADSWHKCVAECPKSVVPIGWFWLLHCPNDAVYVRYPGEIIPERGKPYVFSTEAAAMRFMVAEPTVPNHEAFDP